MTNLKGGIQPMRLSAAIEGFTLFMSSGDYATRTVRLYKDSLGHMVNFLGDVDV